MNNNYTPRPGDFHASFERMREDYEPGDVDKFGVDNMPSVRIAAALEFFAINILETYGDQYGFVVDTSNFDYERKLSTWYSESTHYKLDQDYCDSYSGNELLIHASLRVLINASELRKAIRINDPEQASQEAMLLISNAMLAGYSLDQININELEKNQKPLNADKKRAQILKKIVDGLVKDGQDKFNLKKKRRDLFELCQKANPHLFTNFESFKNFCKTDLYKKTCSVDPEYFKQK